MINNYEAFKRAWMQAFRESGLKVDEDGNETLDLYGMRRIYRSIVEFTDGEDGQRFRTGATLTWSWDALQSARTTTAEAEMLFELLGPGKKEAEPPRLRVDAELHAYVSAMEGIPMPAPSVWTKWARETVGRLERVEPLVPTPMIVELQSGALRILSGQNDPVVKLTCAPDGTLMVRRLAVSGWQDLDLPRETYADDDELAARRRLDGQLRALFARVKSALHGWTEATDHFG
jgi:hypothetical protein